MERIEIEEILKDVREDKIFDVLSEDERKKWNKNPEDRIDLYLREKKKMKMDAERWPLAIASYKRYRHFSFENNPTSGKYFVSKDMYVCYCRENKEIVRLQADLLTNVNMIKRALDKYELCSAERNITEAFYKVSYTIGNFSVIWKNPGGNPGVDTCWDKLANSGLYGKTGEFQNEAKGLENRNNIKAFRSRYKENLFMILPSNQNPKEVVKKLYFQDYFDENWKLRWKNQNVLKLDKEQLLNFIKEITILIVQRSYRIICNCESNILEKVDQDNIQKILKEIGLKGEQCIYSEKKNMSRE